MILRKTVLFFTFFSYVFLVLASQSAPEYELLFEKAKFTMDTKGDLKQAVALFQEIIEKYPEQRQYAAKSHFYIGLCYEKLGYSQAVKSYELVLQKYDDQLEQVAAARARLAALRMKTPGGLHLTKIEYPDDQFLAPYALSPDATKMAVGFFSKGQNIAVYDLVTKRVDLVTQNTWNDPWASYAVWSPDGKKIAYMQGGWKQPEPYELFVSSLDGKAQLLFRNQKGQIIPMDWISDGSAIVAASKQGDDPYILGLVPTAGGDFKALHVLERSNYSAAMAAFSDASPDGKHIVFADGPKISAQDIYCISTDGRSLEVLTDHAASDLQPRWSPDGKHVVFLSFRSGNKALWGVSMNNGKPEGEPFIIKELGQGTYLLSWTAQGLAYQDLIDIRDLYMMPADPETGGPIGNLKQLDYEPSGQNKSPAWSPDGRHLAFFSAGKDSKPGQVNIVVMPAGGGEAHEYLIPWDYFSLPAMPALVWMPDSSGLGFSSVIGDNEPALFRLTLETEKWETWPIPAKAWTRIEWGPGGDTYFYVKHGFSEEGKAGIIEHNLASGEERYVYQPEKGRGNVLRSLKFSWDYKKLVVQEDNSNIVVVDLETGEARTVASKGYIFPSWSADGQNLLMLRNVQSRSGGTREMYIVPVEGGTPKKVELPEGQFGVPCWSPDGKMIAIEMRQSKFETYVMKNFMPKETPSKQ